MTLAVMMREDEDALICDMAETYRIYDYRALPARLAATLAAGLGEDSRIRRKMNSNPMPTNLVLLAAIVDRLSILVWMQTVDGQKNRNRPRPLLAALYGGTEDDSNIQAFESGADFEAERKRLLKKAEENGGDHGD